MTAQGKITAARIPVGNWVLLSRPVEVEGHWITGPTSARRTAVRGMLVDRVLDRDGRLHLMMAIGSYRYSIIVAPHQTFWLFALLPVNLAKQVKINTFCFRHTRGEVA